MTRSPSTSKIQRRPVSDEVRAAADRVRAASLGVRIPLRLRMAYWTAYLGLARRGKQIHSPTADAVYADGFWKRRYERACERINEHLGRQPAPTVDAPRFRRAALGPADFEYLTKARIPYVLAGAAGDLPVGGWTLDTLEAVGGDHDVPINAAPDRPSEDTTRPTKANNYYDFRTGPLSDVLASIRTGGNLRTTVAEDVMHADDERLMGDLDIPGWEEVSGWTRSQRSWWRKRLQVGKIFSAQLIVQPEKAFTLWHAEPGDSFFVLVRGHKEWTLAHPRYTAGMRPRVKRTTNYTGSNIDIREPEERLRARGFDGYFGVPKVRAPLAPGDMLRVPNFWWHTVTTAPGSETIAATMRLEPGPNLAAPALLFLRMLDEQAHVLMRSYLEHGRIFDSMIGYPRPSRAAQLDTGNEKGESRPELSQVD